MHDRRRNFWVWTVVAIAPLLAGVTCGFDDFDVDERTLTSEMSGEQVVPPVETPAVGSATARLYGNTITLQGSFEGLSSPVLPEEEGAVLLRLGAPGENGPAVAAATAASLDGYTGTFELSVVVEDVVVDNFLEGLTYVEVRTGDHPEGELRAQLE